MIYIQKTKQSCTQDLILDQSLFLNPHQYSASSKTDCELFHHIVRQIISNKIVDIYSRIKNYNIEETTFLSNNAKKFSDFIEMQRVHISELCETFGIHNYDLTTDMPPKSPLQKGILLFH